MKFSEEEEELFKTLRYSLSLTFSSALQLSQFQLSRNSLVPAPRVPTPVIPVSVIPNSVVPVPRVPTGQRQLSQFYNF
jgi:hypothetical protein